MSSSSQKTVIPIRLTPSGALRIDGTLAGWQQKLFTLGVNSAAKLEPSIAFWRQLAVECIHSLCHAALPEGASLKEQCKFAKEMPLPNIPFLDSAPPMPGAEYLNQEMLERIWTLLLAWCGKQIHNLGGIAAFLKKYVPGWEQVGRVFFHLGENKLDSEYPFAFLATYVTGIGARGQLRHSPLAEAVKRYDNNRPALMRLLEPVQRVACKCEWIREMCDSGSILVATPWQPEQAYRMLRSAEQLETAGIGVRLPDWWKKRPRLQVITEISADKTTCLGAGALLDFDMGVAIGDENLDDAELERILSDNAAGLVLVKNQWVEADSAKLKEALEHWRKVKKAADAGKLTFQQGMRLLAGVDNFALEADEAEEDISKWSRLVAGPGFREVIQGARDESQIDVIPGLEGKLRPYQKKGVAWLRFLNGLGLGACLADDMGLGKTIQILSLLLLEKDVAKMPALLVAPASLMANWKAECERFAPGLRLLLLHPSQCGPDLLDNPEPERLKEYDLIVTSYAMASRLQWLKEIEWSRVVADEAQNIKNSQTRQSIAVRALKAPARIALTGTPIENSVADIWALFDFINPGLLGTARQFGELLKTLRKYDTGLAPLRRLTSPYILRRMKSDKNVITSLPEKTEVTLYCTLVKEQAAIYQRVVNEMQKKLQELSNTPEDKGKRNLLVLQSLILLKQICNHPAQAGFAGEHGYEASRSGKFLRIGELCSEIAERQERVLIFTQFREIIEPLGKYLTKIFGVPGLALHGQTPVKKRGELVKKFQEEDGPPFFILSLKAGGSGLNLTQARHVIHFDRWWNPAVEEQATDRAYRIGQKNNVLVHKCLSTGTLEEKIDKMLQGKKAIADEMLSGLESNIVTMSDEQIMELVRLDAQNIME